MKRALILAAALAAFAAPALAGPVTLLSDPVDADGRVTLGDLFDDAGAAANVVVGQRTGATVYYVEMAPAGGAQPIFSLPLCCKRR